MQEREQGAYMGFRLLCINISPSLVLDIQYTIGLLNFLKN